MISTQKLIITVILLNLLMGFATNQGESNYDTATNNLLQGTVNASIGQQSTGTDLQNQNQKVPGNSVSMGITWWGVLAYGMLPIASVQALISTDQYSTGIMKYILNGISIFAIISNMILYYELYLIIFNKKNT